MENEAMNLITVDEYKELFRQQFMRYDYWLRDMEQAYERLLENEPLDTSPEISKREWAYYIASQENRIEALLQLTDEQDASA
jgi:hypothetical protein